MRNDTAIRKLQVSEEQRQVQDVILHFSRAILKSCTNWIDASEMCILYAVVSN